MKKTLLILFICLFTINCSNDSENDLLDDPVENNDDSDNTNDNETDNTDEDDNDDSDAKLTYTEDIAPIISANCLSCHGASTRNGAPTSYNTFTLVSNGANRMDARMNNETSPMPTSGLISQESRDKFKQWISDGKLE